MTAALFLLISVENMPAKLFNDPYTDEVETQPDPAADLRARSNFTDFKKNLAYSYANPYPNAVAAAAGYRMATKLPPQFVLAADLNPGTGPGRNSRNHEGRGQNVLFADYHAEWQKTTRCGINGDDIYTTKAGKVEASPVDATDAILLPDGD